MSETFAAMVIADAGGKLTAVTRQLTLEDLPPHPVLVEVSHSSLNYKDGLALTGSARIARRLPMVAGIDLVGRVVSSDDPSWSPGDMVMVNGWGLSETEWGGYSRFQRLKAEWLTRLPDGFTAEEAMMIGTAGYTAALCIDALEDWGRIHPGIGEVLVTGAAGGVGSFAVALLGARGYDVVAASGRPEARDFLAGLGAKSFLDRKTLTTPGGALQKERWTGAVDSVGSATLANVLAQTVYGGAVAACGLAGGSDLPASVMPHILRGVALLGIDSVQARQASRDQAWKRLARDLDRALLHRIGRTERFSALPELAGEIIAGRIRGRVAIDMSR